MKVTDEQMKKIREKVQGAGFPVETIISANRKIVINGNDIIYSDGELAAIVDSVVKPKVEEKVEEKVEPKVEEKVEVERKPELKPKKPKKKSRW